MFSKEIPPFENINLLSDRVSIRSILEVVLSPKLSAALLIAVAALIEGLVVLTFSEIFFSKENPAFKTCPFLIANEETELNISIPWCRWIA